MIHFIEASLKSLAGGGNGKSVLDILRLKRGLYKWIEVCVKEAEGWKEKGNFAAKRGKDKHTLAIQYYLRGLISVWPYTSSSIMMSFEQAQDVGLVKVEQALLNDIVTIAMSYPSSQTQAQSHAQSRARKTTFDNIARVTCEAILEIRYITVNNLRKTFERLAQLDEREYGAQAKEGVNNFMADLFKDKQGDEWAHRFCIRGHVCHEQVTILPCKPGRLIVSIDGVK
ncbi:uncharacterized protein I303_102933 [Kwoniella dejecticola CBS 10117]|uniref:Uncharacterized protein n=1 Tax=Kwoniella dejecticola CBS 10117 TaxID=1296121 RepID=A0A1A6AA52_9TREE|nr:uncharacterized protein I303_02952 [Kwoniella dejecticola CBS 10117]OBR86931.1 hypothetical protein I303_02952 [Kwoniella dejecticola CBS 10117]